MNALYLRFDSQEQADTVLADLSVLARDDVGTIYTDVPDGEVPEAMPGWHVNLIVQGEPDAALLPYIVTPSPPRRRFAGF